jgi:hypothetical protein
VDSYECWMISLGPPRHVVSAGFVRLITASTTTFIVICHYVYSDPVASTKVRALDAAIELLGTEGLRALTHVRVDLRAGLPKGSTSNYFRTRAALLLTASSGVSCHWSALPSPRPQPTTSLRRSADCSRT